MSEATTEVLILDANASTYRDALRPDFPRVEFHASSTAATCAGVVNRCEVLIAFGTSLPAGILSHARRLRWIQTLGAGTDSLLARPDLDDGVLVTSASGIHGPQLSEMAALSMLSLARGAAQLHSQQAQKHWNRFPGSLLAGKRALVVGTGASGEQIRRVCESFGMEVIAASRTPRSVPHARQCISIAEIETHVEDVEFLILVMASGADVRNRIGASVFQSMKRGAFVINVARGDVLDEDALLDALDNGHLGGAALDVFKQEPLPATHAFWSHPKVIVTPHIAGLVDEYESQVLPLLRKNLETYLTGQWQRLVNLVRPTSTQAH